MCVDCGEVEDQEDETVFAAVVGEGEGGESMCERSDMVALMSSAFRACSLIIV